MSELELTGHLVEVRNDAVKSSLPWTFRFDVGALASHIADPARCGFVYFYDAAYTDPTVPFLPIDWGLPALLQAWIWSGDTYSGLASMELDEFGCPRDISAALAGVDCKWELLKHDDASVRERVERLLDAMCEARGIGIAIATKMLHKKRPQLIPVMDSVVYRFVTGRNDANSHTATAAIFGEFRTLLLQNEKSLRLLQRAVGDEVAKHTQGRRHDARPSLSIIRVLDLAIWLAHEDLKRGLGILSWSDQP